VANLDAHDVGAMPILYRLAWRLSGGGGEKRATGQRLRATAPAPG
jgi:hypothetical protein